MRYNRICSDNKKFDQHNLEKWLKARGESMDSLLERGNTRTSESQLTFNITYYPVFQNVRSILAEFQILLAPDKEHKEVFPEVPIVGF